MSKRKGITVLKEYRPLRNEELAAELTPVFPKKVIPFRRKQDNDENSEAYAAKERSGYSLIGVIVSILSLFFSTYILAPIGIVLGYLGYRKGDHSLGIWAIGLGVIGFFGTLIVSAFMS